MTARPQATLAAANAARLPLADGSVHMCVTSPPYWGLRKYDGDQGAEWPAVTFAPMAGLPEVMVPEWRGDLGLEPDPLMYVAHIVHIWRELWRVMRDDAVCWLNLGDSYSGSWGNYAPGGIKHEQRPQTKEGERWERPAYGDTKFLPPNANTPGLKPKDLCGIPWRVAFALQADGWWLRSDVIWAKSNPMPESVTDRPTKAHEYLFLLAKSERYFYDADAVREVGEAHPGNAGTFARNGSKRERPIVGQGYGTHRPDRDDRVPAGRNRRTVWTLSTRPYSGAHYAVFPPDLVEPCIKAGSSEKGVCPDCGAPWERVVEVERKNYKTFDHPHRTGGAMGGGVGKNFPDTQRQTTGWRATCDHDGDPVPSTILDPFAGSGTTGQVARALGRRAILCDISLPYLRDNARQRLELDKLEAWQRGDGMSGAGDEDYDPLPLFANGGER